MCEISPNLPEMLPYATEINYLCNHKRYEESMKPERRISSKQILLLFICCLALGTALPTVLRAQAFDDRLYRTDYRLDPARTGELRMAVENLSFFQNNEFAGDVAPGYTLPGLWLRPKLTFQPLDNIRLEAGLHALVYHGAREYPNYSYQNIPSWQSSGYQRGAHLMPYFRAQMQLRRVQLVLGHIYGGSNHRLAEPLYCPELNLTADPEAGFQLLWDMPRFHLDAWINWESFIFRQDVHNEVFTVGLSSEIKYNAPDAPLHAYTPLQATIQHRGGEIDDGQQSIPVSTLTNGAVGFGLVGNVNRRVLRQVFAEAYLLGYYQQNGNLSPLDKGYAAYAQAGLRMGTNWQLRGGYFYGKDFISLLGLPYFGTVSTDHEEGIFECMRTGFLTADYSRPFGRAFALGAQASLYYSAPGTLTDGDGTRSHVEPAVSYVFGVYFRANLEFLIKRFGKK